MIWFKEVNLQKLNDMQQQTLVDHLDIRIDDLGDSSLTGSMPVDKRTIQPFGILHGGANCVLAETLGSIAANLTCDPKTHHAVGLEIHTSHIKSVRSGRVTGIATAVKLGKTIQRWKIETFNEAKELTSTTALTMMLRERL